MILKSTVSQQNQETSISADAMLVLDPQVMCNAPMLVSVSSLVEAPTTVLPLLYQDQAAISILLAAHSILILMTFVMMP